MAPNVPRVFRGAFKFILKYTGIRKVTGRADSNTGVKIRIGPGDGYAGYIRKAEDVCPIIAIRILVSGMGKSLFPNEAKSLCPHRVRRYRGDVFERKGMRTRA